MIALSISFFLLLISMSENIMETIWEYGVLRSMGITLAQGQRMYIYEAFMVVTVASILGTMCGLVTAFLVSSQLFLFVELPLNVEIPWLLLLTMIGIAITTTAVAVILPIR